MSIADPVNDPVVTLAFSTSPADEDRSFSRADARVLRDIEYGAIRKEIELFFKRTPDIAKSQVDATDPVQRARERVISVTGVSRRAFANNAVERLLIQVERTMNDFFYERLERYSDEVVRCGPEDVAVRTGDLRHRVNRRARTFARLVARRIFPVAWADTLVALEKSAQAFQNLLDESRQLANASARANVVGLRPPATEAELSDLTRRLFELGLQPNGPSESEIEAAATTNATLRSAIREYDAWKKRLDELTKESPNPNESPVVQAHAKRQNAVTWGRLFAFHWPRVFEQWKLERRPSSLARFPTALVIGAGSVGPLFGRVLNGDLKTQGKGGRVERVIVSRHKDAAQLGLTLGVKQVLPPNPKSDEVLNAIGKVAGNREFRFFGAILMAAHDDFATGAAAVEGGFYYRPGRFAEMLGLSADKESVRALDACLHALMEISITATMKVGGQSVKITAKSLIINGQGTLEPLSKRGRGRPQAELYRVQDDVLGLMRDGGAWLPLTRDVLAPPEGVDQRIWDDAFKVYLALGSYARHTPRRGNGHFWRNKVATVLDAANVTKKTARPAQKLSRLGLLCGHLKTAGLLDFNLSNDWIEFDVPKLSPALESAKTRKQQKSLT